MPERLLFNTDNLLRIPPQLLCTYALADFNLIVRKLKESDSQPSHFFCELVGRPNPTANQWPTRRRLRLW